MSSDPSPTEPSSTGPAQASTGEPLPQGNPFTCRMRELAQEYLDKGKVIRLHSSSGQYLAIVSGRDDVRRTELKYNSGELSVACNCAEFPVAHACDHLAAVMLQARSNRWDALVGSQYVEWLDSPIDDSSSDWRAELARVEVRAQPHRDARYSQFALEQLQIVFVLEKGSDYSGELFNVELRARTRDANGGWSESKPLNAEEDLPGLDADDARLVRLFSQEEVEQGFRRVRGSFQRRGSTLSLDATNMTALLPRLAETGRLYIDEEAPENLLRWEGEEPWHFEMELLPATGTKTDTNADEFDDDDLESDDFESNAFETDAFDDEPAANEADKEPGTAHSDADGNSDATPTLYDLTGRIRRDGVTRRLEEIELLSTELFRYQDCLYLLDDASNSNWITHLLRGDFSGIAEDDRQDFLRALLEFDPPPPIVLTDANWTRVIGEPRGHLVIEREKIQGRGRSSSRLRCHVAFDYGEDLTVDATSQTSLVGWQSESVAVIRNIPAEMELLKELFMAGARRARGTTNLEAITVTKAVLLPLVIELGRRNWVVEAEGKLYRTGGAFKLSVSSGIDWFQVDGGVRFGGQEVALPKILSRIQKGTNLIKLGDGSMGVLPDDWMRQVGLLKGLGTSQDDDSYRFGRNQGWVLNAMLAAKSHVTTDADFDAYRDKLESFDGIESMLESTLFNGTLRPYQREALGWLQFLRDFGLGGCLADDMGLGKTVELLAYLESLRVAKTTEGPHLVVAPRSVLGNWMREGEKFAPEIAFIDCSGPDRHERLRTLAHGQVGLITYGTLRRDIFMLQEIQFDTITLDESQAIKNSQSQTAQSARLLTAKQRIALSGTPIENNLSELWSLFEFLNPGMLGSSRTFQSFAISGDQPAEGLETLSRAIRPFVLRRTKEQVLSDLPEKLEQTLYCEMGAAQRSTYEELREYYQSLLLQAQTDDNPDSMQVLEALLRLRQLACHPGLLDAERRDADSVKLDVLVEHLQEVCSTGHKALVFSQFTKFLGLVQEKLEAEGITFEYLDGKTRDRDARVNRFQTDESCKVFLISLKAGGVGLNLTAADYVFILDPWWNPATEAQAIDRAHRIGQEKPVFAYRLVARDTVEERILELQAEKRQLTESIIQADRGLLKGITREDLELLLA